MNQFYTKIITIESVIEELHNLDLDEEQKIHLAHLVDSSMHHAILDAILSELTESDKRIFLQHLSENDHYEQSSSSSKIWKFLNSRVDNIEEKIKKTVDDLKKELHKDIRNAKGAD